MGTCKEATSVHCSASKTASILDPTNWCQTLLTRCQSLQQLTQLHQGLWYFLIVAVASNLIGAAGGFVNDPFTWAGGGATICFLCVASVVTIFIINEGEYQEPPPYGNQSSTQFSVGFWIACASGLLA